MKLVNMKQEPPKPEVAKDCCAMAPDSPRYPYGLQIRLDKDSLAKLGIKDLPEVGGSMKLQATVEVVSISMNESSLYGDNKSMELQITDMALTGSKEGKDE